MEDNIKTTSLGYLAQQFDGSYSESKNAACEKPC